jgi:hypothetical protein
MGVHQPEGVAAEMRPAGVDNVDHFTFAEVVAAAVRPQLRHLVAEVPKLVSVNLPIQARSEGVTSPVMPKVRGIFTSGCAACRDARRFTNGRRM